MQVPEECPAAVNELLSACLDEADRRPPAQQIFDVIQACVLDNKSQRRG